MKNNICYWRESGEFEGGLTYSTDCKKQWLTIDANNVIDSGMIYCPFCGKKIKQKENCTRVGQLCLQSIERKYTAETIKFEPTE